MHMDPLMPALVGTLFVILALAVLLLFFAGMEISIPELKKGWRVPVVGTLLQIAASVGCVLGIGWWLDWPSGRALLLGFVVSLSSTAVVLKLQRDEGEVDSPIGRDVVGVLLVQDVAIIPMLMTIGFFAGDAPSKTTLIAQLMAGVGIIVLLGFVAKKEHVPLPIGKWLGDDMIGSLSRGNVKLTNIDRAFDVWLEPGD